MSASLLNEKRTGRPGGEGRGPEGFGGGGRGSLAGDGRNLGDCGSANGGGGVDLKEGADREGAVGGGIGGSAWYCCGDRCECTAYERNVCWAVQQSRRWLVMDRTIDFTASCRCRCDREGPSDVTLSRETLGDTMMSQTQSGTTPLASRYP